MALLTVMDIDEAAVEVSASLVAADAGGDSFANTGDVYVWVANGDASPHTITVTAQNASVRVPQFGVLTKADSVTVVPAGESRIIGAFPQQPFNNTNGQALVTYDAVTSLTVGVFRMFPR